MKSILQYKVLLWDFDGVIMDSMPVRSKGFEEVLCDYPREQVEKLLIYHNTNGGLSRYVKFKYFFEEIRKESVSNHVISDLAENFSKIMLSLLLDNSLLIDDSISFIKKNFSNYSMHIVSGSDGVELNYICNHLDIAKYFLSINGSPTPKKELIEQIFKKYNYNSNDVAIIGDSINDVEAADFNGIDSIGYNNTELKEKATYYIDSFRL